MTNDANEQGQDVFDDSGSAGGAATGEGPFSNDNDTGADASDKDDKVGAAEQEDEDQTGEDESGTPPEAQEGDPEFVTDAKGQKMIPEHRFKAALKKVTDELDETKGKLKEYETPQVQVPDKDTDPQGYDLHTRMEASKQVMMEMRTDYQEKINHFAEMAKDNPLLNQAVAGHPLPAKLAYDIAAKDLEIKEALALKGSDDWKEFQEFKKQKATTKTTEEQNLNATVARGLRTVPNLNRSTNASPNRNVRRNSNGDNDDDLFKGAL